MSEAMQFEDFSPAAKESARATVELLRTIASLPPQKDVLTLDEAAEKIQCSPATLKRDAKSGKYPHFFIGNQMRFHWPTVTDHVHRRWNKNK